MAEQAEPALRGPHQARWLAVIDAEHDNLRAAMSWALNDGDREVGLRIGAALWRFWQIRGHLEGGRALLQQLLETGDGSVTGRAAAQLTIARCAFLQGGTTLSIGAPNSA